VQREVRRIEVGYELRRLKPGDGTAAKRPTSKEHVKAQRLGQDVTSREILRACVCAARLPPPPPRPFFALLEATGVTVRLKLGPSGDPLSCNCALAGDTNDKGEPVFYAGSTLAGDLSLPKIRQRLATTTSEPAAIRPGNPWHQATAERIPHHLTRSHDEVFQGQLAALGGALGLLPLTAPAAARAKLERAALAFERATGSRIAAGHASARVLRRSVQVIWKDPAWHGDGAGLAMLLDVALTAVAYTMHSHRTRQHAQQQAATEQTLIHLQAGYAQITRPVLASLSCRALSPQTKRRYAHHLRQAAPEHAERILADSAWDALATVLAEAEAAGHNGRDPRPSPPPAHARRRPQPRTSSDLAHPPPRRTPRARPTSPSSQRAPSRSTPHRSAPTGTPRQR
jgi:hypothetical protein